MAEADFLRAGTHLPFRTDALLAIKDVRTVTSGVPSVIRGVTGLSLGEHEAVQQQLGSGMNDLWDTNRFLHQLGTRAVRLLWDMPGLAQRTMLNERLARFDPRQAELVGVVTAAQLVKYGLDGSLDTARERIEDAASLAAKHLLDLRAERYHPDDRPPVLAQAHRVLSFNREEQQVVSESAMQELQRRADLLTSQEAADQAAAYWGLEASDPSEGAEDLAYRALLASPYVVDPSPEAFEASVATAPRFTRAVVGGAWVPDRAPDNPVPWDRFTLGMNRGMAFVALASVVAA
jgi:hypothetical protein